MAASAGPPAVVKVAVLQVAHLEPFTAGRERVEALIGQAVAAGAAIVVLPEFPLRAWFAADVGAPERLLPRPEAVAAWAAALSSRHGCHLHCVDLERDGDRWYNTARCTVPRARCCSIGSDTCRMSRASGRRPRPGGPRRAGQRSSAGRGGARPGGGPSRQARLPGAHRPRRLSIAGAAAAHRAAVEVIPR